jgi:DNA-3-methyladenine glycosylase
MSLIKGRLDRDFFLQDVLEVARQLPGTYLVRKDHGRVERHMILEVEAYRGEEDQACHARRGPTPRTRVMYRSGGLLYIYLIYGIHWMLNIVTGEEHHPQAVLIRGLDKVSGPGRLTRALGIDDSFNGEDLGLSERLWVEDHGAANGRIITRPRVGVDYAGEPWKGKPWRFILGQ